MAEEKEAVFAIIAEIEGRTKPLYELHLPLSRLLEAYVAPFEADEPFIVDGVSIDKGTLRRFKVVQETEYFSSELDDMGWQMRHQMLGIGKEIAKNYSILFDDLLRSQTTDVTNQLLTAYKSEKPVEQLTLAERTAKFSEIAKNIAPIIKAIFE